MALYFQVWPRIPRQVSGERMCFIQYLEAPLSSARVAKPSFAQARSSAFCNASAMNFTIERVVPIAAASTAGAVGGNSHAQAISTSRMHSETMILILADWSSVPTSKVDSLTVLKPSAIVASDWSPWRNTSKR